MRDLTQDELTAYTDKMVASTKEGNIDTYIANTQRIWDKYPNLYLFYVSNVSCISSLFTDLSEDERQALDEQILQFVTNLMCMLDGAKNPFDIDYPDAATAL